MRIISKHLIPLTTHQAWSTDNYQWKVSTSAYPCWMTCSSQVIYSRTNDPSYTVHFPHLTLVNQAVLSCSNVHSSVCFGCKSTQQGKALTTTHTHTQMGSKCVLSKHLFAAPWRVLEVTSVLVFKTLNAASTKKCSHLQLQETSAPVLQRVSFPMLQ